MKAQELRIGNLFIDHRGEINKVDSIGEYGVNISLVAGGDCGALIEHECHLDKMQPIPLTAEWLEKFGFLKEEISEQFVLGRIEICETDDGGGYSLCEDDGYILIGKPFQYVHQLQNLYFALTGEELTISEKTANIESC